jgi:hypoxanthine phosphoribosyltransferase
MMDSYDYARRKGVHNITWSEFGKMTARLASYLEIFAPQIVVGIARGGLFPATAVACSLRVEMFPVRITRRINDEVVYNEPVWKVPITDEIAGKTVAIVDEIADSGKTLAKVAQGALEKGATKVITACLVSHSWADPQPGVTVLKTDAFVIFPWDWEILQNGEWKKHPEIESALKLQGR